MKEREKELDRSIIGEWEDAEQQRVLRSCTAGVESFIATAQVGFGGDAPIGRLDFWTEPSGDGLK